MRERGSIPDCCGDNHHRPDGCQRRIGGSQPQWTSLRPLITSSNPSATSCESSRLRGCERRSMKNQDFEKLGYFYLGKEYDLEQRKVTSGLVLYESKQLTTHAVCVGMTGSGKTGLCMSLLEEAAIDGIPVIAIDPKGDLGNLLLSFPKLRGEDFAPWVDPEEANRQGLPRQGLRTTFSWVFWGFHGKYNRII